MKAVMKKAVMKNMTATIKPKVWIFYYREEKYPEFLSCT